ncbi:hypothetical protein [Flavobacterium sp.]|uniref:hypothetical protein n=1 Tax=Flavobacterium sp. TaxID=239 RepID=UPI003D0B3AC5
MVKFDFDHLFNGNTNKILVVTLIEQEASISDTDILKTIYKAYEDFANKRKDVGIVVVGKSVEDNVEDARILAYSTANELFQSKGNAIINRTFDIPREIKLNELTFGFTNSGNGSRYGFSLDMTVKRVDKYDVSIESGALFNGQWGGSKLRVVNN